MKFLKMKKNFIKKFFKKNLRLKKFKEKRILNIFFYTFLHFFLIFYNFLIIKNTNTNYFFNLPDRDLSEEDKPIVNYFHLKYIKFRKKKLGKIFNIFFD